MLWLTQLTQKYVLISNKGILVSIMASATSFCFCMTQKHLTIERTRPSRDSAIILSGRKWPMR
jgi:hypothetical protein